MRLLRLGDPEGLGVFSLQHPLTESNQVIRKLECEQHGNYHDRRCDTYEQDLSP